MPQGIQRMKRLITELAGQKIQWLLALTGLVLMGVAGLTTSSQIQYEHQAEMNSIIRQNANLTRAFEESVRHDLSAIDELLLSLQKGYEKGGAVTQDMLFRMENTTSLPTVHISIINEKGVITHSTLPRLVSMDISGGEYFQAFLKGDDNKTFFAKPIVGRDTKQWLFHASRRLNKPDGSLGGAVNVGVDPLYFAEFFRRMELGEGYGITLLGRDDYIRVRQTKESTDVGSDARQASVFKIKPLQNAGAYTDVSIVDNTRGIYTYRIMPNFPFILSVSVLESEALADFYHRREQYLFATIAICLTIFCVFALLIWMVTQKLRSEEQLRQAHI